MPGLIERAHRVVQSLTEDQRMMLDEIGSKTVEKILTSVEEEESDAAAAREIVALISSPAPSLTSPPLPSANQIAEIPGQDKEREDV